MKDPLLGSQLGEFIVEEALGEGSGGTVYRAVQPLLQREAAVKVMRAGSVDEQLRFVREARLASRLEHPYTASIYAFGVEPNGMSWIAMELVRGTTLNKLLKTNGPIPLERFVPLLEKICEVVHTAHETGIIHRDLKPSNVMVISRAGQLLPKLLDFGIAKRLSGTEPTDGKPQESRAPSESDRVQTEREDEALGQTVGVAGSPPYMSPEQWQADQGVSERTDIYSLGVISYQALTGRKPFQGDAEELEQAHRSGAIPSVGPEFPPAVDQVIARAMAKRPEDRFESTLAFGAAMRVAAGLQESLLPWIPLEEALQHRLLTGAPQPIAEVVADLATARNVRQARDQIAEVVRAAVRYLGVIALACRAHVGGGPRADSEWEATLLRKLRRQGLEETEWLELARELCRPYAGQRETYPIPELVAFLLGERDSQGRDPIQGMAPLLELPRLRNDSDADERMRGQVDELMPRLADFLRAVDFLRNYALVVPFEQHAELWMGNRLRETYRGPKAASQAARRPLLVGVDGQTVVQLWPFAVVAEPSPGTRERLFLLEGGGRHGAKRLAFPSGFEQADESFWPWFEAHLFATDDSREASLPAVQAGYLGLRSFESKDAGTFFGREKETEQFLNRLRVQPLLVLAGPSGAGKTSFLQAGVIPGLPKAGRSLTVRPGAAPLATLASRLAKEGLGGAELRSELAMDPHVLGNLLRSASATAGGPIVLIVDQLEELFTLGSDRAEVETYAKALALAAGTAEEPVRVICTIRDDFLARAKELPGIGEKLARALELLTTPRLEQLVRILVEPARQAGYEFEDPQMAREIAAGVEGRQGALPLLAFCAARLWELRDRQARLLRRSTYQELGGVGGALAEHAETMLKQMPLRQRTIVRDAFRRLVTGEGTRALVSRAELEQVLGGSTEAKAVLESLIAARVLTVFEGEEGVECLEVIHEALLTSWPRLVRWRQEDVEGARLRDQLRDAARQWDERGRPGGLLWRKEALTELQLWRARYRGNLAERETAFSNASLAEGVRGQRRKRLLVAGAMALLLVALLAAGWINHRTQLQLLSSYQEQGRQELLAGRTLNAAVYLGEVYQQGGDGPALRILLGEAMRPLDVAQIASFEGHSAGVNEAVFSPVADLVASASDDYTARIWNPLTGRPLRALSGHTDEVLGLSFSHDGKRIATASRDRTAKVWDASTGRTLLTLVGHSAVLRSARFSPDDRRMATTSDDGSARIWDAQDGRLLLTIDHNEPVRCADFSPDGTQLVTAGGRIAKVWDAASGELLFSIQGHTDSIRTVVFSRDGRRIATASDDRTAKVWDADDGRLLASLEGHRSAVTDAGFSPDGSLIVTSASDRTIRLWHGAEYRLLTSLEVHASHVWSVDFNRDATRIVTASYDGTARIWDVASIRPRDLELARFPIAASSAWFCKDGSRILASGGPNAIRIYDADTKKLLHGFELGTGRFRVVNSKFSPDCSAIVTAAYYDPDSVKTDAAGVSVDRTAKVWDAETGRQRLTLTGHQADVISATFSPSGDRIVTTSFDGTARVWDSATGQPLLVLQGHAAPVNGATYSPDGRRIVTASSDGTARIWDATTGRMLSILPGNKLFLIDATFSPDGRRLVTGGIDATPKMWDPDSGRLLLSFEGHSGDIRCSTFSRDGQLLGTGSGDGSAKVWDAVTGKLLLSLDGHTNWVNTVDFAPDGKSLLTASADGTVRSWRLPSELRSPAEVAGLIQQRVPLRFDEGLLVPVLRQTPKDE